VSDLPRFSISEIAESTFRNFDLEDVHIEGAERIAEAVAKYDVDRFIHVSSYNADKNSPSEFFRTKVCT
jgi:NADH dehydrogenase (ubiquinone) 1 alpha subcomplex subunit 9